MRLVRARTRQVAPLPLIGMIDAFFLLLIYFLVSATITPREEELAAALAADSKDAAASDLEPQVVEVTPDRERGAVFVVSAQRIATQPDLTILLEKLPKEGGLFVRAADDAPVWAVAAALQAAEDAGFERLTYVAPE